MKWNYKCWIIRNVIASLVLAIYRYISASPRRWSPYWHLMSILNWRPEMKIVLRENVYFRYIVAFIASALHWFLKQKRAYITAFYHQSPLLLVINLGYIVAKLLDILLWYPFAVTVELRSLISADCSKWNFKWKHLISTNVKFPIKDESWIKVQCTAGYINIRGQQVQCQDGQVIPDAKRPLCVIISK